jgi:hypothetical protein
MLLDLTYDASGVWIVRWQNASRTLSAGHASMLATLESNAKSISASASVDAPNGRSPM